MTGPFDLETPLEPTEYGGKEGLVQKREDGHTPTPSERNNMDVRGAKHWVLVTGDDGISRWVQDSVDPVTGESVPVEE